MKNEFKNEKWKNEKMNDWTFFKNEKRTYYFNDWFWKTRFWRFQWLIFEEFNDCRFSLLIFHFSSIHLTLYSIFKNEKMNNHKSQKMKIEKRVQKWKMKNEKWIRATRRLQPLGGVALTQNASTLEVPPDLSCSWNVWISFEKQSIRPSLGVGGHEFPNPFFNLSFFIFELVFHFHFLRFLIIHFFIFEHWIQYRMDAWKMKNQKWQTTIIELFKNQSLKSWKTSFSKSIIEIICPFFIFEELSIILFHFFIFHLWTRFSCFARG